MGEASWRKHHGGDLLEEASWRREAAQRSILEGPGRHPGGIAEDIMEKVSWRKHLGGRKHHGGAS